eukprot:1516275-Pyramimonas_sp.AAC.1
MSKSTRRCDLGSRRPVVRKDDALVKAHSDKWCCHQVLWSPKQPHTQEVARKARVHEQSLNAY